MSPANTTDAYVQRGLGFHQRREFDMAIEAFVSKRLASNQVTPLRYSEQMDGAMRKPSTTTTKAIENLDEAIGLSPNYRL